MKKIQYEIDPHNRLVIPGSGLKSGLPKFRQVIDGRFSLNEKNNLSYRVKAPLANDENIPRQIKLKGEWSLTDDHDLRLTLDGQGRQTFGDQITLQGEILDVNKGSLLFAVTTTTKDDTRSTYVLNLDGTWKADENNRLSFHVKKEEGRYDILTFNGAWEINKNHQIIYQYEKARLIRKKKRSHALIFKGYWDIKDLGRISYLLGKGTDSSFDFKTSAGIFRGNYIKYELGIGLSDRIDPVRRTVTLSGKWNLKKDVGLIFEIDYENKKAKQIVFGADARLTDRDTIAFKLKNDIENKDIGADLELSHKILEGDGEAFLRLLKSNRESAIYAGAAWRW
ncbi:MAG: hypothetical protein NTY34_05850 [Candidatus Omnitrophica bacterium]|nr:hypothetical protein [Candidatus Omnitrophota bacterium]